jgi:hypothetical protein
LGLLERERDVDLAQNFDRFAVEQRGPVGPPHGLLLGGRQERMTGFELKVFDMAILAYGDIEPTVPWIRAWRASGG